MSELIDWFLGRNKEQRGRSTQLSANEDRTWTERQTDAQGRTTTREFYRGNDGRLREIGVVGVNEENSTAAQRAERARQDRLDGPGVVGGEIVDREAYEAAQQSSNEERQRGDGSGGGGAAAASPKVEIPRPEFANTFNPTANSTITQRDFATRNQGTASFNIQQFRQTVADNVLPTHSFLVTFSKMNWVSSKLLRGDIERALTLRCENAILPTIGLLQHDNLRRYGYGPIENVPYGYNMGDFTLQFLVDRDATIVQFFEEWTNVTVNRESFGGATMDRANANGKFPYQIEYKDNYVSTVNVFVYDRSQNNVIEYNIYDAYPNNIQSMNLSWSDENQLMRLNVGFSFTDMKINSPRAIEPSTIDNVDINALLNTPLATPRTANVDISAIGSRTVIAPSIAYDTLNQPISIGDINLPNIQTTNPAPTFLPSELNTDFSDVTIVDAFGQELTIT